MEHASSITRSRAKTSRIAKFRDPAVRGAQLLAVSGFALAQPLFDILGKNAEFFAVRGSTPADIVFFALVVTLAPAMILLAIELLVELVTRREAIVLHHVFLGLLAAVFGVQALKRGGVDSSFVLIGGAVAIGVALAFAAWRVSLVRTFLTILSGASLIFLATFLFDSNVEELVFPSAVKASAATVQSTTPVVYLLFDEFPVNDLLNAKNQIDAKRFPNFARLARTSTWFRNTTTLSASTTVAVPVILTGNPPVPGALPIAQNYPHNLFTLLANHYRMKVTESQTRLCPTQICHRKAPSIGSRLTSLYSDARVVYLHLVAPPSLEGKLPAIDESWGNFGTDTGDEIEGEALPKVNMHTFYIGRLQDFNRFIASFETQRPQAAPTLYFLHLLMPHGPWLYTQTGKVRAVTSPRSPGRSHELWWNADLATQAWQRHLLQVGYTDTLLGRLIDRLRAVGLWNKALVVVDPDHGISFHGDDLRRDPTQTNLSDLAFIPLFMKLPGERQGRVVDTHVTTEDILPTIADVLGIDVPWETTGVSMLSGTPDHPQVHVGKVTAPYAAALAQRQRRLRQQLALFGTGAWGSQFAGTGRFRGLVGKPVLMLNVTEQLDNEAIVDKVGSRLLRNLPKNSPLVPSPVVGTLPHLRVGQWLALALNGRIAAVSHSYGTGGKLRFALLAGDDSFRAGTNDVRMFVVTGATSKPRLQELHVSLSS
ncbi:MAG: sulfatase-like hydrolase/transferase [Gaiellaceae bacterium]